MNGPHGRGTVEAQGLEGQVDILVGTLGKAFGAAGAFALPGIHQRVTTGATVASSESVAIGPPCWPQRALKMRPVAGCMRFTSKGSAALTVMSVVASIRA